MKIDCIHCKEIFVGVEGDSYCPRCWEMKKQIYDYFRGGCK